MSEPIIVQQENKETNKTEVISDDKNIWMLMIIGGIFFGFIPALFVYLFKTENPFLKSVAKDNLNFQISFAIYGLVASITLFILIGLLLLPAVIITGLVLQILAAIAANNNEKYKYPLTIKFLS